MTETKLGEGQPLRDALEAPGVTRCGRTDGSGLELSDERCERARALLLDGLRDDAVERIRDRVIEAARKWFREHLQETLADDLRTALFEAKSDLRGFDLTRVGSRLAERLSATLHERLSTALRECAAEQIRECVQSTLGTAVSSGMVSSPPAKLREPLEPEIGNWLAGISRDGLREALGHTKGLPVHEHLREVLREAAESGYGDAEAIVSALRERVHDPIERCLCEIVRESLERAADTLREGVRMALWSAWWVSRAKTNGR